MSVETMEALWAEWESEIEVNPEEVFDVNGNQMAWAEARARYGNRLRVRRPAIPAAKHFYLKTIRETMGPAAVVVRLYRDNGDGVLVPVQTNVGFWWPNPEPGSGQKITDNALSQWHGVALPQMTDVNGQTGFGMGGGSVIKEDAAGKGGPHDIWVLSPSATSDVVEGVGWLGGTDHAGMLSMDFVLMPGEVIDPDPDPEPDPDQKPKTYEITLGPITFTVQVRGVS